MNRSCALAGISTTLTAGLALGLFLSEDGDRTDTAGPDRVATAALAAASQNTQGAVRLEVAAASRSVSTIDTTVVRGQPRAATELERLLSLGTPDALFKALSRIQAQRLKIARSKLASIVATSARAHHDWELQELVFAFQRRVDPKGHRERVLALSRSAASPVGLLVGALSSIERVDPTTQRAFLEGLARTQSAALVPGLAALETTQRRELAQGAMAELVGRISPHERVEWLLRAASTERRLLAAHLGRKGMLTGQRGLNLSDARLLVEAIVRDAKGAEDLKGWGPELRLVVRLVHGAHPSPALQSLLDKAKKSSDKSVRELARDLLTPQRS